MTIRPGENFGLNISPISENGLFSPLSLSASVGAIAALKVIFSDLRVVGEKLDCGRCEAFQQNGGGEGVGLVQLVLSVEETAEAALNGQPTNLKVELGCNDAIRYLNRGGDRKRLKCARGKRMRLCAGMPD